MITKPGPKSYYFHTKPDSGSNIAFVWRAGERANETFEIGALNYEDAVLLKRAPEMWRLLRGCAEREPEGAGLQPITRFLEYLEEELQCDPQQEKD